MRARIAAGAAALLLAGCSWFVHSQAFRYDQVERPARPRGYPIPVIADTSSIGRPFVVIGMVQAEAGTGEGIGERELQEALRREARKLGGDALCNLQRRTSLYGAAETFSDVDGRNAGVMRERTRYRWTAEVISYDLPSAPARSPQPGATAPPPP